MKKMSAQALARQQGVSKIGLITLLLLLTLFITVGLKVGPVYVDHNLVTGVCQELVDSGEAASLTVPEIRNRVGAALRVNNVSGFDVSSIRKRMENNAAIITVTYERRVELFGNLDVVAKFDSLIQ